MIFPWLAGFDVGQTHDPAALAIAQHQEVTVGGTTQPHYLIRHLERFELGTSYPDLVKLCNERLAALPQIPTWRGGTPLERPYRFLIDATSVGRPVVDLFRHEGIPAIAVTMTFGDQVRQDKEDWRNWFVPKRALVAATAVALQQGRLQIARDLPESGVWAKEMQNFQYKIDNRTANDSYGAWREGEHDDLMFASGLIVWYGEQLKRYPHQTQQQTQTYDPAGSPHSRMSTRSDNRPHNPFMVGR